MKPAHCFSERQIIPRYQGAEGLGKSCPTLKKTPSMHMFQKWWEKGVFFLTQGEIHGMPSPTAKLTWHNRHKVASPCLKQRRCCQAFPFFFFFPKLNRWKFKKWNVRDALWITSGVYSHGKLQEFWELTEEIENGPWNMRVKQNRWASLAKERWRLHPISLIIPQRCGGSFTPVIQQLDALLQDELPWKTSQVWCVQD